jgi:hypothetical protein
MLVQYATHDDFDAVQLQRLADEYDARAAADHRAIESTEHLEVDDSTISAILRNLNKADEHSADDSELYMFKVPVSV